MSGPCVLANHKALVLAASRHNSKLRFDEVSPNGLHAQFEYVFYSSLGLLSRFFNPVPYVSSFFSRHHLAASTIRRQGFQCYFSSNNNLEPKVSNWTYPFKLVAGYEKWTAHKSVVLPKEIHRKLTTDMLTTAGFISFREWGTGLPEPERKQIKPRDKQYYVGLSGGGWRALAGHMGAFRALSNKNALGMVNYISSVSGGTWFISKLAFESAFSKNVLRNERDITDVVSDWMEREYFPVVRNTTCSRNTQPTNDPETGLGSLISTAIARMPNPVGSPFLSGTGVAAAHHFNFSWQHLVEQAVLHQDIAQQNLDKIHFAPEARANFGKATLAFNWNQLHQWDSIDRSACSKWFLTEKNGEQHVQYPVYTSALYNQLENNDIELEVKMKGKQMKGLFNVCYKKADSFCLHASSKISMFQTIKETVSGLFGHSESTTSSTKCDSFEFETLTVGQVVSASSAAAGGAAVQAWTQSMLKLAQQTAKDALKGGELNVWYCSHYRILFENILAPSCNRERVVEEFLKVLGCETHDGQIEDFAHTAKRWTAFLKKMAVRMSMTHQLGNSNAGHMAIDGVRTVRRYVLRTLRKNNMTVTCMYPILRRRPCQRHN